MVGIWLYTWTQVQNNINPAKIFVWQSTFPFFFYFPPSKHTCKYHLCHRLDLCFPKVQCHNSHLLFHAWWVWMCSLTAVIDEYTSSDWFITVVRVCATASRSLAMDGCQDSDTVMDSLPRQCTHWSQEV